MQNLHALNVAFDIKDNNCLSSFRLEIDSTEIFLYLVLFKDTTLIFKNCLLGKTERKFKQRIKRQGKST